MADYIPNINGKNKGDPKNEPKLSAYQKSKYGTYMSEHGLSEETIWKILDNATPDFMEGRKEHRLSWQEIESAVENPALVTKFGFAPVRMIEDPTNSKKKEMDVKNISVRIGSMGAGKKIALIYSTKESLFYYCEELTINVLDYLIDTISNDEARAQLLAYRNSKKSVR